MSRRRTAIAAAALTAAGLVALSAAAPAAAGPAACCGRSAVPQQAKPKALAIVIPRPPTPRKLTPRRKTPIKPVPKRGLTTAVTTPSIQKFYNIDSTHRFQATFKMQFNPYPSYARGYSITMTTEAKSGSTWVRKLFCTGQVLDARYSVRESLGHHPDPDDWWDPTPGVRVTGSGFQVTDVVTSYWKTSAGGYSYVLGLTAHYDALGSCLYPFNVDRSLSVSDLSF